MDHDSSNSSAYAEGSGASGTIGCSNADTDALSQPATIASLSPEILETIFFHLSSDEAFWAPVMRDWGYKWTAALRVCRLWNDVAIGCPRLWTYVSNTFTLQSLERLLCLSKAAPLNVDIQDHSGAVAEDARSLRKVQLILAHFSRFSSMKVWCDSLVSVLILTAINSTKAPRLIEVDFHHFIHPNSPPPKVVSIDRRQLPSLKQLSLANCSPNWSTPIFHDLTSLKLTNLNPHVTFERLMDILRRCPLLEDLALRRIGPLVSDQSSTERASFSKVDLQNLRFFRVDMDHVVCHPRHASLSIYQAPSLGSRLLQLQSRYCMRTISFTNRPCCPYP